MASIHPDQMIRALSVGMFPMAPTRNAGTVDWIEPTVRGIIPIDGFHASKTLLQKLRSERFTVTVDEAFARVVASCAEITSERIDTWISPAIEALSETLYRRGQAHSIECWRDGALVGGLFGISLGALFVVESKFSRVSDASKIAFAHLMVRLKAGGYRLVDCQFITPHLASIGAVKIDQKTYRQLLEEAIVAGGLNPVSPLVQPPSSPIDFFALDRISRGEEHEAMTVPGRFIAKELARTGQPRAMPG